ncbi:GumC family protein [Edaphobacter aggregans]|uniref:GumC family protein n=1 Tax=Edaphobacter aggregans TaxID=570835 RepID=UPI0005534F07|nr:polysaccharide biosynthesis tyrosine autokinase [Edaphobacter aggregans]
MKLSQYYPAVELGEALPRRLRKVRHRKSRPYRRRPPSDWFRAFNVLSKQWRWSALFAITVIVAVTVATFSMTPVYESEGRLQIDPPGAEVFSLDATGVGLIDSEYIATEAQKLQTDDLALATIRALHLDSNPEISSEKRNGPSISGFDQLTQREMATLRRFKSRISVRRDPSSRLVGVTFAAHDPRLSADVVNTLMRLMVQENIEARRRVIAESSVSLSGQLDDIRAKMESSAGALADFGAKTGIADVDPNSNTVYAEKMGDLNRKLVEAESDRIQFQSFLEPTSNPESLPQVRNNLVVQALTQKRAEAEAQLAQSRVIYGPNHVEVRKLQNQVSELESQLKAQSSAIVSELWTNYRAAKARAALLNGQVKGATTDLAILSQYNVLKREAQADRALYDTLYAKIKEAGLAAASKSSNVHIVSQARVLDRPTRPKRTLNIMAGIVIGLIGGVALAFIKDRIQDRIHTADEIREWTGLPPIAIVPAIQAEHRIEIRGRNRTLLELDCPNGESIVGPNCFLLRRPQSPESEAVHALRTLLFESPTEDPPRVILITSSLPGEGKTTLANNLAIALAKHGRTCLVDADLRMPAIGGSFNLLPTVGLEHYLQGSATLEQVMYPSGDVKDLTIIPSTTPTEHINYLLTGSPIRSFMMRVREHFDFVVIDTPPILLYADGLAVSTLVDGVILVGRAGQTPKGAITRSMELLETMNSAPILSIVLNAVDERYGYSAYSS